jgi:polyhydroxyalkanoate synthesis regulator phasin
MAKRKKGSETGTFGRLSKRGEEAVNRLVDELGKNERVTDALGKAMSAKGKLDGASRRALGQIGLAPADEVKSLRKQVEQLEKRLAKLETGAAKATTATRKRPSRARKTTEGAASPASGRAVGGGTSRGSGAGGTTAS